jgi:predicted PolB exonuclease-like 3'-5' exonuclease
MNTLVFDIETVPDVELGRRLYGLEGLADEQVARAMFALRRQRRAGQARSGAGADFLPLEQQRVVAISCALRGGEGFRVWSLGDLGAPEGELVQRFFDGIEKFSPDLVSWNGSGFDLPVLTYRALLAGVQAPRFWETGDEDPAFRYNNYLSRYHRRHTDLMDVLSGYQGSGRVSLANMACLLGLPGKLGFEGSQVWQAWQGGDLAAIRRYCETDVLNTWLIYLRFALLRGQLTRAQHAEEVERVRGYLRASQEPHCAEFLRAWQGDAGRPRRAAPREAPGPEPRARTRPPRRPASSAASRTRARAWCTAARPRSSPAHCLGSASVSGAPGGTAGMTRRSCSRCSSPRRCGSRRAVRISACAAAARCSTWRPQRSSRPSRPSSSRHSRESRASRRRAGWRRWRARPGVTVVVRVLAPSTSARRAASWSDFASAPPPTSRSSMPATCSARRSES